MSQIVPIKIKADTGQAVKDIDKVGAAIEDTGKKTQKATADVSEMGGQLDTVSGGAITKLKGLTGTLKSVGKGFVTLKGAIISSGIGALALIIGGVVMAFKDSEEGQNKFAKIMSVIGSVVGNLTDKLSDLGMKVLENPLGLLEDIGRNLLLRLKGIIMLLPSLGKAIKQVLSGDFKEAGKTAADAFLLIGTGVENATDKIADFTKEIVKDGKKAASIADARAKADKAERDLIVDRAEADRDRAKFLEQAIDKEKFSTKERIGFLQEAGALEEKITNQEIEAARIRAEAKILENTLSKSTKEDLIEEEQLKARLIQLETAKLTKAKEVTGQIIALRAEEAAALKLIEDQKALEEKERLDKKAAEDKERDDKIAKEKADAAAKALEAELTALKEKQDAEKLALDLAKSQRDNTLNAIISLAGEGSKVGKAAALAQATISGIQGVQAAFTTASASPITAAFPPYPFIQAGLAGAFALKSIQSIVSSKKPSASGGGGGGGGAIASTPPDFNVVGAAPENQLAETISGESQKPVKTFVVASDISSAQSLDRNIIENASIG